MFIHFLFPECLNNFDEFCKNCFRLPVRVVDEISLSDVFLFTRLMTGGVDLWSCSSVSEVSREASGRDLSPQRSRFSAFGPEWDLLVTEEQASVHQKDPEGLWLVVDGSCSFCHQAEGRNKSRCPAPPRPRLRCSRTAVKLQQPFSDCCCRCCRLLV